MKNAAVTHQQSPITASWKKGISEMGIQQKIYSSEYGNWIKNMAA
jgi:hypothetical protein